MVANIGSAGRYVAIGNTSKRISRTRQVRLLSSLHHRDANRGQLKGKTQMHAPISIEFTRRQLMAAAPGGGPRNICSKASQAGTASESRRTFHNPERIKSSASRNSPVAVFADEPRAGRPLTPARRHKPPPLSSISNQQREHRGVAYRGAGQPMERHQKAHGGLCRIIHQRPTSSP